MARVRPFAEADIPEVVNLRAKCFRHSVYGPGLEQQAYFREIFFDNPWRNDDFPSYVCEEKNGTIVGFLGSIARPMRTRGESIWMAVPTQLMVDPEHRGMSGFQLLRTFLAGPQDLSFADAANSSARELWGRIGGATATLQSFLWTRPLRPCSLLLTEFGPSRAIAALGRIARPVSATLDHVIARTAGNPYQQVKADVEAHDLDVAGLLECYGALDDWYSIRPSYELHSLDWLLQKLEATSAAMKLRRVVLRGIDGEFIGWYLYFLAQGGIAQVVQLGAHPEKSSLVFQHMYYDAWERGSLAVSGRVQPEYLTASAQHPGRLTRAGPWTLLHSKNAALLKQALDGDAWLTRLEGEWWMNF